MLVKVSVENFKSFDKAAELTMISSNKIRTNANHRLKIKSTQLLKYAVVYGANASGKTNLALFFKFFKDSVCNGIVRIGRRIRNEKVVLKFRLL